MVAGLTHKNDEHTIAHMNTENRNGNYPADHGETVPFSLLMVHDTMWLTGLQMR